MDTTVRPTDEVSLGLMHEVEVTGRKVGATPVFWAKLAHDQALFARVVDLVMGIESVASDGVQQAADIMGTSFLGPDEVEKHLGRQFSAHQRQELAEMPFSVDTLRACRDTHVLIAAPTVSLMTVFTKLCVRFRVKADPWYGGGREKFASTRCMGGWYLVRKSEVPDSRSKTWNAQQQLVAAHEFVPSSALVALAVIVYYEKTGTRLLKDCCVRTSDVNSGRNRLVFVGDFDEQGLGIASCWDLTVNDRLGVSSARSSD